MPVIAKVKIDVLLQELQNRYVALNDVLKYEKIKNPYVGLDSRHKWKNPDAMRITKGNDMEIRMAVDDFKTVLSEIRKLK